MLCCRFPSLYPVLEPEYVAKVTVAGTLRDQPIILIPQGLVLNFILNAFLPMKAALVLLDFLQVGVGEHAPGDEKKSD
ncbi:hypothetical protein ACROYT_G031348 [Oculina patagonica]